MRIRGYFQFANLRLHYIGFHKASFKCILTGKIPLKQWTMKISQFASKIASQQSVEQLHYWHFKQLDQTLLSDFGSLQRFQLIKFSLIRWWHKPHASPHPSKSCDHVMQVWVWTKRRDTTQMWETLMSTYKNKCGVSRFFQSKQKELGWQNIAALYTMIPLTPTHLETVCVLMDVAQIFVVEERRMRAGPAPELTPGPALAHSTCYSMAGSTWGKNTNFHAFMASKNSNFQIIFNITCSYWAARSSRRMSSKCQTDIGKPFGTQIHCRDSWRNVVILRILRILVDVKQGSPEWSNYWDPDLKQRWDHVGANWSLVRKEFLWANLGYYLLHANTAEISRLKRRSASKTIRLPWKWQK